MNRMLRRRLMVSGTVQGVGFRPFIYRLALQQGLTGLVRNAGYGVTLELQGDGEKLDAFIRRMMQELPAPAQIERCSTEPLPPIQGEQSFSIAPSATSGSRTIVLAPDNYVCPDCLGEMWDGNDRRHHYPFISCTACGPRYTITKELPYDRSRTTMACFTMCPDCQREYTDPADRRFHAQPIACPACGPRAWLVLRGEDPAPPLHDVSNDPAGAVFAACDLLEQGRVVAVKGIGGFLLAVDARNQKAVQRLRRLKRRERKPLAVMVRDLQTARSLLVLDPPSENLLCGRQVPIVVAEVRPGHGLAPAVAPGLRDLGVMLPSTPLHHLLFGDRFDALVMTSANAPSEPMITENRAATAGLDVDAYLLNDRDIHLATDDSVIRTGPSAPLFIRRARGYVPDALEAAFLPDISLVALGAQLKVAIATLDRGKLIVGRHLGDLDNAATEQAFRQEVERMLHFGRLRPQAVAVDLHPDLASTLLGEQMASQIPLVRVQHHHAHLCAVLVEHGFSPDTTATGVMLDGLGYGPDGTIWGGEVIRGGYGSFQRVGHLRYIPQPGGDRAALQPGRMATSLLRDAGLGRACFAGYDEQIARICSIASVSPLTSSAGRLFDGVAAILGVAPEIQSYEGEAATLLEAAADPGCTDAYPLCCDRGQLDTRALIIALVEDGSPVSVRAARFHNALADGFARLALSAGSEIICLGGGCMVNRLLLGRLESQLMKGGATVIKPVKLPAGDGGLAAGQAAAAACMVAAR